MCEKCTPLYRNIHSAVSGRVTPFRRNLHIRDIICPQCKNVIQLNGDREFIFCSSCGTRINLNSDKQQMEQPERPVNFEEKPTSTIETPQPVNAGYNKTGSGNGYNNILETICKKILPFFPLNKTVKKTE